jgi:hypothetical protein
MKKAMAWNERLPRAPIPSIIGKPDCNESEVQMSQISRKSRPPPRLKI